jgi:hexosaminidase
MIKIIPQPLLVEYIEGRAGTEISSEINSDIPNEGYIIDAIKDGIKIQYSTESGLYYANKTIKQILSQSKFGLPQLHIEDTPKYGYRGFMLDCSRHFFDKEAIKKYIDILADLKINKFHWHLTDDQGWRVEIKAYPLLTEVGSKRKSTRNDGIAVEGFYTQDDIKEIISYCNERFIEVIPEIDMPGHFTSAIASYPNLGCEDKEIGVSESFGIHADIACAGKESTYIFCENVLKEIFNLFPSKFIHLGGDEALKLKWINCPDCQKAIKENNLANEEELQGYFMNRMVNFAIENGKDVINWNDGLLGGNINDNVVMQYWEESKKSKEILYKEALNERKVIMSPFYSYYMDYPYGMTSLKKTYNYEIDEKIKSSVIGLETPIWTEYVENTDKLEYMIFPRLIAIAERAWSLDNHYDTFLIRLEEFNNSLDEKNIKYAEKFNPNKIISVFQVVKFFRNAFDTTLRKNLKLRVLNKSANKLKYGKK